MLAIKKTVQFGKHTLTISTGVVAKQATGSVMVDMDGTMLLCTVVGVKTAAEGKDFFPLKVDYQERAYASGDIPGGFFRREGRPSERETLIGRLIDRPLRPLFPNGFSNEVQIVVTLLSLNPEVEPDVVAMIGSSAAVAISGLPFHGPMAAARVGYINNQYVLNPTQQEMQTSALDLVVAGTNSSVLMVESEAKELAEDVMLGAVMFGHNGFQPVIQAINALKADAGKEAWDWQAPAGNVELQMAIKTAFAQQIEQAYAIKDKQERQACMHEIRLAADEMFVTPAAAIAAQTVVAGQIITAGMVRQEVEDMERAVVRSRILASHPRIDGRDNKTVRPIKIETGVLPRTHGSALFTRGETQALVVVTLGSTKDAQMLDTPFGDKKDVFMLHYNFPPYCVGEVGMVGSPKRREIGHGKLAKRAMMAVLPKMDAFPYVLRVVSEITESNGSSSMATVCGSSLALMDAGVPTSMPVAGIAMGLIKEGDKFAVITDILGDEDHLGDMDFKVAGTTKGVTALQMDIKINGITEEIMQVALAQALSGRMHILEVMQNSISKPKADISDFAPRIITFKIKQDKIKDVIGKGGATIKGLIEGTNASIDIQEDGTVQIACADRDVGDSLRSRIDAIVAEVEVGTIYEGTVVRIVDFGAFVNILPGKDGLVHISQIANHRVADVTDELEQGQKVKVKVIEIDRQGRIKLSMRALLEEYSEHNEG